MENCIFCKIAERKANASIIDEEKDFMAFMDIYPPTFNGIVTSPNVLVITKKHYKSNAFEDLDENVYSEVMEYARKIAKKIQKSLKPLRVCMVVEGMEIEHFHIKLYPIFRQHYPGYLSTEKGKDNKGTFADKDYLDRIAKKIANE